MASTMANFRRDWRTILIRYRQTIISIVIHIIGLAAELVRHGALFFLPLIYLLKQAIHLD